MQQGTSVNGGLDRADLLDRLRDRKAVTVTQIKAM
jgi:hypothetical protein